MEPLSLCGRLVKVRSEQRRSSVVAWQLSGTDALVQPLQPSVSCCYRASINCGLEHLCLIPVVAERTTDG